MNLANTLSDIGRLEEALEKYLKAQKIYENYYGTSHTKTSFIYHNLGSIYIDLEEYELAKSFTEKALAICKRNYGLSHQETKNT
jgi:tetratricopeptide (TPR) repeat protein